MFVYMVKFLNQDHVKIGCAKNCLDRASKLGTIEYIYTVLCGNNLSKARLTESMFHHALASYRVPRQLSFADNDGSSEYFLEACQEKFFEICQVLNLECFKEYKGTGLRKVDMQGERFSVFKENHEHLTNAFVAGFRSAMLYRTDKMSVAWLDSVNAACKKLKKSVYKQCLDIPYNLLKENALTLEDLQWQ